MFAMRVRVRPCRLLWKPSSLGRSTRITPSSRTTRISGCKRRDRVPRGPFTVTIVSWSIATSTPAGISMGCLPIRLIASSSPHVGQDLAADATARGLPVSDHALGGGQDGDAEPAHDPRKLVAHGVHAATWGGDAAQAGDGPFPLRPVLQADPQSPVDALALSLEAVHEPFRREDLEDGLVELGRRHEQVVLVRHVGVADPRQHVGDGIGDVGPNEGFHHDAFVTPGSSPMCASSRKQIRHSRNLRYTARAPSNGNPSAINSALPSSSVFAVVATVMSIPRTFTTLS